MMRSFFGILFLFLALLPVSGKQKERITERGSSLFYRSWRYPVVMDENADTTESVPADDVAVADSLPQDTVPMADSIAQDTLPPDTLPYGALTNVDEPPMVDSSTNIVDEGKIGGSPDQTPVVVRPDINTCIVYFIFDQNNFIADYSAEFDTIMAFIDYHKGRNFEVIGHTDERGTVSYNQGLSERRAKRVYDVLVRRGVDPKRLIMIGRSELEMVFPHAKNEREHLLNRRVVVRVKEK